MCTSENMATVRRAIEEQFSDGGMAHLEGLYTSNFVIHDPANPDLTDLASNMGFIAVLRAPYPDAAGIIEDQFAAGDRVAKRWTFRGTTAEPLVAGRPAGITVEMSGITIARLREGRIAEEWVEWDAIGLTRQLEPPSG